MNVENTIIKIINKAFKTIKITSHPFYEENTGLEIIQNFIDSVLKKILENGWILKVWYLNQHSIQSLVLQYDKKNWKAINDTRKDE